VNESYGSATVKGTPFSRERTRPAGNHSRGTKGRQALGGTRSNPIREKIPARRKWQRRAQEEGGAPNGEAMRRSVALKRQLGVGRGEVGERKIVYFGTEEQRKRVAVGAGQQ